MYGLYDKKNLNLIILKILWEHTDENHRLMQQEVRELVKLEYGLEIDRRSVKNNMEALQDMFTNTELEISMENGYCLLARDFTDAELRMLIDSVLFSHTLPKKQVKDLVGKLKRLSSKYFSSKVSHISNLPDLQYADQGQSVLYNLDILHDAISENKKISFTYNSFGTDFRLHPRREKPYIASPYQMVTSSGRYYLICNFSGHDNLANIRIDKMSDINILQEKRAGKDEVPELLGGLSLPKHMAEHIYMFSGKSVNVIFECDGFLMDALVDWFGKEFRILEQRDDKLKVRVICNEEAFHFWALQYGAYVEVLEPASLREQVRETVAEMTKKYDLTGGVK